MKLALALIFLMSIFAVAQETSIPDLAQLNKMAARFAPTPITLNTSSLSRGDRILYGCPARRAAQAHACALQRSLSRATGARGKTAARGGRAHVERDSEDLS